MIGLQKQLDALITFILDKSIIVPVEELSKDRLDRVIHEFHFGEDDNDERNHEANFFELLKLFISVRIKPGNRKAQFGTLIRVLKRYELYCGKCFTLDINKVTDLDLVKFEEFLRIEHSFLDQKGNCIKYACTRQLYKDVATLTDYAKSVI